VALAERFAPSGAPRPDGITCERFEAPAGSRRCAHYVGRGACGLEDEFMCVEWLRVNGHPSHKSLPIAPEPKAPAPPPEPPIERDLFGNPVRRPARASSSAPTAGQGRAASLASRPPGPVEPPSSAPPIVRTLSDADVAAFVKLGVEVCLETASCGELWLVPAYTHTPGRQEISIHDAATLAALCAAFPGAQITGFTPSKKHAPA
jgi:hypothetical protein